MQEGRAQRTAIAGKQPPADLSCKMQDVTGVLALGFVQVNSNVQVWLRQGRASRTALPSGQHPTAALPPVGRSRCCRFPQACTPALPLATLRQGCLNQGRCPLARGWWPSWAPLRRSAEQACARLMRSEQPSDEVDQMRTASTSRSTSSAAFRLPSCGSGRCVEQYGQRINIKPVRSASALRCSTLARLPAWLYATG